MTLKEQIKASGVRQWQIADRVGLSESQFIRVLRHESKIAPDRRQAIESAIKALTKSTRVSAD